LFNVDLGYLVDVGDVTDAEGHGVHVKMVIGEGQLLGITRYPGES
jgi:hypothetical protein